MPSIPDGKVWCEGCNNWLPTTAAWLKHRHVCRGQHRLVENRPHHDTVPDDATSAVESV